MLLASIPALKLSSLINALPGCIAQGIVWGIMALGLFLTFRILDFADLTVDGSFATGGAVTVMLILAGWSAPAAMAMALAAGLAAGLVTGLLHTVLGIAPILSGILTQIALYSVNLHIMGNRPNVAVSVDKYDLFISLRMTGGAILGAGLFALALIFLLYWFLGTELGSSIRATGSNPTMAKAQSIDIRVIKVLTLALSNGIVAVSGGLMAQYQGFSDVQMGRGAIVIGLAAIIIGDVMRRVFFKHTENFALRLVFVTIGGIIYYLVVGLVLWLKLPTNDLKLFTAIIVAAFLAIPNLKKQRRNQPRRAQAAKEAPCNDLCDIHKTFHAGTVNERHALNGINLHLNTGDFVTIIGSNGAGKSTMLNAVAGVWPVDRGTIYLDGQDITDMPEHRRAALLGRVFQDPMNGTAADMQLEENLALAARRGRRRGLRWGVTKAERVQFHNILAPLGLGLENRLTVKVGLLSGGQRQAVTLVMATLQKPKLLLLDEHTAALDPKTAQKVLELTDRIVAENGLTALMVTHNMNDAIRHGNRLIMMNEGQIIFDCSGEEKSRLTVEDLMEKFAQCAGGAMVSDRALLN